MNAMIDPAALRGAAARLRLRAESVATIVERVDLQIDGMVFAGPAADRLRGEVVGSTREARVAVGRLVQLAETLSRQAAIAEEQALLAAGGDSGWYDDGWVV